MGACERAGTVEPMHRNARAVLNAALRLPEADRAEIAGALVASLEPAEDGCLEPGWRDEIAARVAKTNAGRSRPYPGRKFAHGCSRG